MMAKSLHVITIALTLAACGLIFDSQRVSTDGSIRSRLDNLQTTSSCSGEERINRNDDVTRTKEEHPSSSPPPLPPPPLLNLSSRAEFFSATASSSDTRLDYLTPLRSIDQDQYTIRILSWKRAEFLAASVAHHSQCPGVKQIQIVWSVLQEEDSAELDTGTDPYKEYR